jgi:hypothetical protein
MTYEEDLRRLLSDAATEIPAGNAPVAELVREGKRSKSRRHLFQAVSVAAVVALILVGAFLVQYPVGGSGNLAAQPTTSAGGLAVPADTRLVGINLVAVAVPEDWSTNDTRCGFALSDTVDFNDTTATHACAVPGTENFSRLHAAPLSSEWGQQWSEPLNGRAVDLQGIVAQRLPTKCRDSQSDAGVTCSGRLIMATADAVMSVNSPNREVVDAVLDSATLIPEGYTVVPDLTGLYTDGEVEPLVESAGLLWENRCPDGHVCDMDAIEATDPAAGSVVPEGITVRAVDVPRPKTSMSPSGEETGSATPTEGTGTPALCEPQPPRNLLNGSPAGPGHLVNPAKNIYAWGTGNQEISQSVGGDPLGLIGSEGATKIRESHWTAYIINIGDPGVGEVAFAFNVEGCNYTVWLPGGTTMGQARDFAPTLGTPPTTPPLRNELTEDDRRVAKLFHRFADDASPRGPFDTPVSLGLANRFVRTITEPNNYDAWTLDLAGYADRVGQISALRLLRENAGNLRISNNLRAREICGAETVQPPPSLTGGGRLVSIQPRDRNCMDWWSVDLFVNDVGQVVGVNVTLGIV